MVFDWIAAEINKMKESNAEHVNAFKEKSIRDQIEELENDERQAKGAKEAAQKAKANIAHVDSPEKKIDNLFKDIDQGAVHMFKDATGANQAEQRLAELEGELKLQQAKNGKPEQKSQASAKPEAKNPVLVSDVKIDNTKILEQGHAGEEVGIVQQKLGIKKDNKYGPGTEKAVKEFQAKNGLDQDGIVGPETWAKLQEPQQTVTAASPKKVETKVASAPKTETSAQQKQSAPDLGQLANTFKSMLSPDLQAAIGGAQAVAGAFVPGDGGQKPAVQGQGRNT